MSDNEITGMMKDLDRIYEELKEEQDCKFYPYLINSKK